MCFRNQRPPLCVPINDHGFRHRRSGGRLLIFESSFDNQRKQNPSREPIPESIIEIAKWWREFKPGGNLTGNHAGGVSRPMVVGESAEATRIFDQLEENCRKEIAKIDNDWAGPYKRTEESARKLGVVRACSENKESPFIGAAAATWASELAFYLTRRLVYLASINVAENDTHDKRNRVLQIIIHAGSQGIRHSRLYDKCRFLKGPELKDVIASLLTAERIIAKEKESKTKPFIVYCANE